MRLKILAGRLFIGVPAILPDERFLAFKNMRRERSQKLCGVKLTSSTLFGVLGSDVVLHRKLRKRWSM
jgi:hypothetical protein